MATIGELFVKLRADTSNFEQGMDKARNTSGTFKAVISQNLNQIGQQMSNVGKNIISSIGSIVTTASEWTAQVEQQKFVYNNLDGTVQKAINNNKGMASSLGMTKQQYMNNSTAVADFLARMGMSSQSIADQSGKVTQLTADMAAFADVPVDEATSDFKSALVGNFNALDKYGVSVNVATINSGEYAKSLGKSWDKMTQAEKAQAILSETLAQSSSYTGLATQESEGFTMKMQLLKQQIMETAASIGEKLFPVLEPLITKIVDIAKNIANWANEHPKLTQGILLVIGVIGGLMAVGGPLLMLFASLATISLAVGVGMLPLIGIIAGVTAVIVGLVAIGVALWQNWDTIKAKANEIWNNICTTISNFVKMVKDTVKKDFEQLKQNITIIWNAIKSAASTVWNGIKTTISNVVNTIKSKVTSIWNAIKSTTSSVFNGIKSVTSSIWNGIKSSISSVVNTIKSTVSSVWNGISSITRSVFNSIKSVTRSVWNGIKTAITTPITAAKNTVKRIVDQIKGFFSNMKLSLPKITIPSLPKLPSVKISGGFSLNPPSVPKISWNAKGGIFNKPTIFGTSAGLQGVGEAGAEAILPLAGFYDHLDKKLDSIKDSKSKGDVNITINSPKALSPYEIKRQFEQSQRKLAMQLG